MTKDTCCGCAHITTGAAVMGVLQAVIVVMLLSTSAILLQRSQIWKTEYETYLNVQSQTIPSTIPTATPTASTVSPITAWWTQNGTTWTWTWRDSGLISFIEIHLTHHIAFYSLWLVFLGMFALAYKAYRPALVLPNLIMQVISVALLMILGGVIIAKLVSLSLQYQSFNGSRTEKEDLDTHYAAYSVLLGCLVIGWVAELVFIYISIEFYHFIRDMQHTVHPGPTLQATITGATVGNQQRQHDPQVFAASIETTPKYHGDAMA